MKTDILRDFKRIIFPARCPGCDSLLSAYGAGGFFCDDCYPDVVRVLDPVCLICGKPIKSKDRDLCRDCESRGVTFLQGRGVFLYTGPMKMAMYRFKYSGRRAYAKVFAELSYRLCRDYFRSVDADVIIPVPMYEGKKIRRGYNQAEVFANELSKLLSVPVRNDILIRVKNTVPQKGLDRENRQKNMKNAFKIAESVVKFNCVLIVDDIYTTGATINEAAEAIRGSFGCSVYAFYLCVGTD